MPEMLLVPVRVEGLWLGRDQLVVGSTADFSRLPFDDGLRDINPDVANISEDIVSQPFEDQNLYLKAGVHLHWTLPRGLTMQRPTPRGPEFPAVPDRWLVVRWRRVGARWDVEMSWVVESNYLFPDGQGRIREHRFPAEGGASEEARPTPVPLSRPESAAGCLACEGPRGRIPGSPHRRRPWRADLRRVLSRLPERPRPARRSDSGSARGAGYDVFGWYSDGEKNPLAQYFLDFQRAGWKPSKPEATIQDDFARAVAENLGWSVNRAPGPSFPGRLLCLGRLAFDIPGPVAEAPSFSAPDPKIVLASTGTEALSVYLAGAVAPDQAAQVEDQLEALLLAPSLENRRLDLGAKLAEGRHEKGFQAVDGGSLWGVRRRVHEGRCACGCQLRGTRRGDPARLRGARAERGQPPPAAVRPRSRRDPLDRRQLFADWYKSMICASSPDDGLEDYPDLDEVRHFIETKDLEPLRRADGAVGKLAVNVDTSGRLSASSTPDPATPTSAGAGRGVERPPGVVGPGQ